jgi:ring-1,2-phenylacetyl-CoA epoxidase subunit PaaD
MLATQPTIEDVWQWLGEVPDPEIPVVTVTELGIVRDVSYRDETLVVTVTPTYTGCPATAIIRQLIEEKLEAKAIAPFRIEQRLSPPWTTDWLTDAARRKLKAFGIAPPVDGTAASGHRGGGLTIACPRCQSTDTEKVSQFGSTPCKAAYRCKACLEPFDYFKCI